MISIKKRIFNDNPDTKEVTIYISYMDENEDFYSNVVCGRLKYEIGWEDPDCEKIIDEFLNSLENKEEPYK